MQNFKRLKYWMPLIGSVLFVAGLWLGIYLSTANTNSDGEQKLHELLTLVRNNYVDEVEMDSLVEKALPAILANLDPHSVYIPASELEKANEQLRGSFGGVGIQFQLFRDTVNVVEVIAGGPSELAGLQAGDRIIAVNGHNITGKTFTEDSVRNTLRGSNGSKVRLTVRRPSKPGKDLHYTVTRGMIPVESVDCFYMLDKTTGVVKVNNFGEDTYREFLLALNDLTQKGAKRFIIDLRGNTGGYMETAILMVNEFLHRDDVIVSTVGRITAENEIVSSDGHGSYQDAELIVLLDEMSASSSEIFAGAIQDNDRGLVMGRRSFGKGLVQRPITFDDGSEVRLTVQRYHTPSGRCIQKDYKPGANEEYELEIFERYRNGETLNKDSIRLNKDLMFKTVTGRPVYGGGGIMPDIFVSNDTTGVTGYYLDVANKGLLMDFAYEYADLNRASLKGVKDVAGLMRQLPNDDVLLSSFVYYATTRKVPARWYYIKQSRQLIVNQLKALIARDVLGIPSYYQVINQGDLTIKRALEELNKGSAAFPIMPTGAVKKGSVQPISMIYGNKAGRVRVVPRLPFPA